MIEKFKDFFCNLRRKENKPCISEDFRLIMTFGDNAWRIESKPIDGKSNIKLFADNKLVFEGSYSELVSKIKEINSIKPFIKTIYENKLY